MDPGWGRASHGLCADRQCYSGTARPTDLLGATTEGTWCDDDPMTGHRRIRWLALSVSALALAGCSSNAAVPTTTRPAGPTRPLSAAGISGWHEAGSYDESSLTASEGLATVTPPAAPPYLVYRGISSVPAPLAAEGWGHIGDPDSAAGTIVDAFQGPSSGHTKMFLVTSPNGATTQYVHTLVPGEEYNNSFDAISPDSKWMVAGEWDTMHHLQVYPAPGLRSAISPKADLRLAGEIRLDHAVRYVQGCDFVTATRLICASDDSSGTLFANPKPLLEVTLPHPLDGTSVTGRVTDLGSIPQRSTCTGFFEAEGVDYAVATRTLRVEIIQPGSCILHTTVYEYTRAG